MFCVFYLPLKGTSPSVGRHNRPCGGGFLPTRRPPRRSSGPPASNTSQPLSARRPGKNYPSEPIVSVSLSRFTWTQLVGPKTWGARGIGTTPRPARSLSTDGGTTLGSADTGGALSYLWRRTRYATPGSSQSASASIRRCRAHACDIAQLDHESASCLGPSGRSTSLASRSLRLLPP